ncbi:hypothetical protein CPTD_00350 [Corynebacterium pseudotuberculosis]|nr:Hypothetical protein BFF96_0678 [Corynebacterium pseudotuberculosis]AUY60065.1 Hypothetical protein BFG00_0677 [Corynebacterium pseudotuberculosis]KEX88612.1 hypothetical protein CPTD_00350 [Corynebacterium pseudotuberculosis]
MLATWVLWLIFDGVLTESHANPQETRDNHRKNKKNPDNLQKR